MTPKRPLLRYHGGKWLLAPWIISNFPVHSRYVEPFGGAASVLLRKPPSTEEIYNDMDNEIVNLFKVLREQPEKLMSLLRYTPYARQEYKDSCSVQQNISPVERARRTLVRSFMGFGSGSVTQQYFSGFRSIRKKGSPARGWMTFYEQISIIADRIRSVCIENRPALEIIKAYDWEHTLFYIDPPYLSSQRNTNGNSYRYEMTSVDHQVLANVLHDVRGAVIISGYDCPEYETLYPGWQKVTKATNTAANSSRTECLWLSPSAVAAIPQGHLLGVSV